MGLIQSALGINERIIKEGQMMRRMTFSGVVMTYILALILVTGTGFIFVAQADKPPWAGIKVKPGYAKLTDDPAYVVWSDVDNYGVSKGQYEDEYTDSGNGEDMVELGIDKGDLVFSQIILGIVNDPYNSSRRVRFLFDIDSDAINKPGAGTAVYEILLDDAYGTPDGTVHFRVMHHIDDVAFIIDPGCGGTDSKAITQTAMNDFYEDDEDYVYETSVKGHVIYYLDYPDGVASEPVAGMANRWTIEPSGSSVTLYVIMLEEKPMGNSGKVRIFPKRVDLAEYNSIPFQLTVSTESFEGSQAPPRSDNTLSSLWGKIKAK